MADVVFKDNSKQVLAMMDKKITEALYKIGLLWLKKVSPLVPVDTSRLLKSMRFEVDIANQCVIVGTDVLYSIFVELGTYKMAAQPYMKPSILDYVGEYQAIVKKVLGSGWSASFNVSSISY